MSMKHNVEEIILDNGAKGLLINTPDATVMKYSFHFRAGNRQVKSPEIYETAHIMEHMAFGANALFASEQEYSAEFSKNGAYNNAYTSDNSLVYLSECADFEWERILKLQEVAICQPKFNEDKLQSEKGNIRSELSGMLTSHSNLLWPRLQQMVGEEVLTLSERLTTINDITLDDIVEHHTRTHTLKNLRFVIVGNLSDEARKQQIIKLLSGWELPEGTRIRIPKSQLAGSKPVLIRQSDSKSITFGFTSVRNKVLNDFERNSMSALNHILTGTMFSRIFGKAREAGLVYSLFSDYDNGYNSSSWDFAGQVLPDSSEQLFDLIVEELRQVLEGGLKEEEINATKTYAVGRYQMGAQTVSQVSDFYSGAYFMRDQIRDYDQLPKDILEINKEEIVKLANKFVKSDGWALAVVGDTSRRLVRGLNTKLEAVFGPNQEPVSEES